jgi:solute carrier family 34 (sodium-dependent phosphate cotransporter)
VKTALKVLGFLLLLYSFFVCIELMGGAFKLLGKDAAIDLLSVANNPLAGLLIGILATSIVQSSSTTTSIMVGMVATGSLTIQQAVPMVMGANIGTTVTAAIVSMGHVARRDEFERAFAGATVHDFFNLLAVALFLPLEIMFHPIARSAQFIAKMMMGLEGATFASPLKVIVKPVVKLIISAGQGITDSKVALTIGLLVLAFVILVFALSRMVTIMRGAVAQKLERIVDKVLFTSWGRALTIGAVMTAIVQSSSVTTSVVVPLLGAGIVRLEQVFPYMLGANIGTTVTAFLASFVTGSPAAVTLALCHLLFNLFGTVVFLPLRFIPIKMARWLGEVTAKRRWVAPVYVGIAFFGVPGILLLIS